MHRLRSLLAGASLLFLGGYSGAEESQSVAVEPLDNTVWTVWTVDLVSTMPGQQAEYVRSIEANWSSARAIAVERGAVLSYRALVTSPDSGFGWDILLMTQYTDSTAWANREGIFEEIFASPEFVRVPTSVPSSELRSFAASGVVMLNFVSGSLP